MKFIDYYTKHSGLLPRASGTSKGAGSCKCGRVVSSPCTYMNTRIRDRVTLGDGALTEARKTDLRRHACIMHTADSVPIILLPLTSTGHLIFPFAFLFFHRHLHQTNCMHSFSSIFICFNIPPLHTANQSACTPSGFFTHKLHSKWQEGGNLTSPTRLQEIF